MNGIELPAWFAALPKITRYVEIDEILRSADFVQGTHREEGQAFLADALLLVDGDEHFRRRRLESPLFGRDALAHYEQHSLGPVVDRAFEEVRQGAGPDGRVRADVVALTRTALHRIAAVTTGIDGVEGGEGTAAFIALVDVLGDASTVQWSTRPYDEVVAEGLACRDEFVIRFFGPSLARREELVAAHRAGRLPADRLPRDLLTALLLDRSPEWDDGLLLREATLYLIAATRTTTHAVPHSLHHLLGWLADHPGEAVRATDRAFLRRVGTETLRLHPPSPALVRMACRDVTLGTGRRIAAGERVGLLFGPGNRDRDAFGDDADEFDPDRTMCDAHIKAWGLSFGGGEHLCMGRSLVTGLAGRGDRPPTEGTLTLILEALVGSGARPDPDDPQELLATSLYEAYARYPVVLTTPS